MGARSLLFLPANRLNRLAKALESGARYVIVDLEDGVGAAEKESARASVRVTAIENSEDWKRRVLLRINAPGTASCAADLEMITGLDTPPAGLLIPKAGSLESIREVASRCALAGHKNIGLHALIESARGLLNLPAIANSKGLLASLSFGSADYCAETGAEDTAEALLWARSAIVAAATGAGVPAYDSVCLQFGDQELLRAQCVHARRLGFAGKLAIHPDQVAVIDEEFSPSDDMVRWARRVVQSEANMGGIGVIDGEMIDAPVLARAHRILEADDNE
jgi:citrate lyase subunit beta/citryl-CoA lyase